MKRRDFLKSLGTGLVLVNLLMINVFASGPERKIAVASEELPSNPEVMGYSTIQETIDAAEDYSIVLVPDGIYTGEGNTNLDFKGKPIKVISENGPEYSVINCEHRFNTRGFYFHEAEDLNSILQGFSIINGYIPGDINWQWPTDPWIQDPTIVIGGGIYCELASPTIINCVIKYCATELGGGIGCVGASPAITDCTIAYCDVGGLGFCLSGGYGGGIGILRECTPSITNCTIRDNSGYYNSEGGGIYCCDSSPEISGCTISGNNAKGNISGGGIYCSGPNSNMIVKNCIISHNSAESGGGIACQESNPLITNCTIFGNTAGEDERIGYGGGIYSSYQSNPTIINCTISGNSAQYSGSYGGGGIYCTLWGNATVTNCIMWSDTANQGSEIYLSSYYNKYPSTITVSYSDVQGGAASVYMEDSCTLNWEEGNIDADPRFVVVEDDYHLQPDSPCRGSGKDGILCRQLVFGNLFLYIENSL